MARLFTRVFRERLSEVALVSRDPEKARKLSRRLGVRHATLSDLGGFQALLFTTPSQHLPEVVEDASRNLGDVRLVMDTSSVKSGVVERVAGYLPDRVEYISLHPLFAPWIRGIRGQNIVVIPVRGRSFLGLVKDLLEDAGLRVVFSSPEEHDRVMALIQVAHHLSYLSLALTLHRLLDPDKLESFSTRSLRRTSSILKTFARNLKVIREISSLNPHKSWALSELRGSLRRLEEGGEDVWREVEEALRELAKLADRERAV